MALQNFKELHVWQKAMDLVTQIYGLSSAFPKEERFGLSSQIRRCAVSLPSNIAEGAERHSTKDFLRFVAIAQGSLAELETQLLIAQQLKYAEKAQLDTIYPLLAEVGRMLHGLRNSLTSKLEDALTTNH